MDTKALALQKHKEWKGKIQVTANCPLENSDDLSIAYTPGVAAPCVEINKDVNKVYDYTRKGNLVAVVTDGTAVLGLGDIGPEAGMPVMEGKSVLFKAFADAGVNIRMIDQGSSEMNIIVGVDNSDYATAIKAIYDEFVQ